MAKALGPAPDSYGNRLLEARMPKTAVMTKAIGMTVSAMIFAGGIGASQAGQNGLVAGAGGALALGILLSLFYVPSRLLALEELHLYENGFQARLENGITRMHYGNVVAVVAEDYVGGFDPLDSAKQFVLYAEAQKAVRLNSTIVSGLRDATKKLVTQALFQGTNSAVKELSAGHGYESPLGGVLTRKAAQVKERTVPIGSIVEHNGMNVAVRGEKKSENVLLATKGGVDLVFVAVLEKLLAHYQTKRQTTS